MIAGLVQNLLCWVSVGKRKPQVQKREEEEEHKGMFNHICPSLTWLLWLSFPCPCNVSVGSCRTYRAGRLCGSGGSGLLPSSPKRPATASDPTLPNRPPTWTPTSESPSERHNPDYPLHLCIIKRSHSENVLSEAARHKAQKTFHLSCESSSKRHPDPFFPLIKPLRQTPIR